MVKAEATFQIVTPMFMSGSNQNTFELRASSIKGALRFWWRALAYGRFSGDLRRIRLEEAKIFGSSDLGQGSFLLKVEKTSSANTQKASEVFRNKPGLKYLGLGIADNRQGIAHGSHFSLSLLFRENVVDSTVIQAIKALGLLSGLGGRSRRGFGSLTLEQIKIEGNCIWEKPLDIVSYATEIAELLKEATPDHPKYSAFSTKTRIEVVLEGQNPIDLHNNVGLAFQRFRSAQGEKNFPEDARIVASALDKKPIHGHPKRIIFGLPHNYFFKDSNKRLSVKGSNFERRASPLFIHIHNFSEGRFAAVILTLPGRFLPEGEEISVGSTRVPQQADYRILDQFLNGLGGRTSFPEKRTIYPLIDK